MPPKRPLTAINADVAHSRLRAPAHPLTTQGKIARAEIDRMKAAKNVPREAPDLMPRKLKARSLAPPGEQAWWDEGLRRERKKGRGSGKPVTTQEKIWAVRTVERRRRGLGGGEEVEEGKGEYEEEEVMCEDVGPGGISGGGMVGEVKGFTRPSSAQGTAGMGRTARARAKAPSLMDVERGFAPTTKSFSFVSATEASADGDEDVAVFGAPSETPGSSKAAGAAQKGKKKSKITPRVRLDMSAVGASPQSESEKRKVMSTTPTVMTRRTQRSLAFISQTRQAVLSSDAELRHLDNTTDVKKALHKIERKDGKPLSRGEIMLETASKLLKLWAGGAIFSPPVLAEDGSEMPLKGHGFRLMDLPKELRMDVWKAVVVETKTFVRPASRTGREQPDLAMTCRQVRGEVLPVFYRENAFAVDVAGCGPLRARREGGEKGMEMSSSRATQTWAGAMEEAGWFQYIRHWVFTHTPSPVRLRGVQLPVLPCTSSGFLPVSLLSEAREDEWFILALDLGHKKNRGWDINVEVHREASCIMPDFDAYGTCHVKRSPTWLNEKLIENLDEGDAKVVPAGLILELAKMVQGRVNDLIGLRCSERALTEVSTSETMDV